MFWLNILVAVACGAFLSIALPPISLWLFVLAITPVFVLVACSENPQKAFLYGFFFAVPFFALYLLWLPTSFSELFGAAFWATYPPMLFILGCMWGIVTWLSRLLAGRGSLNLWLLPALWVLMEWARTQGNFAFPWGTLGYIWLDTPLAQLADIAGVYGLSFLTLVIIAILSAPFIVLANKATNPSSFGKNFKQLFVQSLLATLVLLSLAFGYSKFRLASNFPSDNHQALLVQGNTDPLGRAAGTEDDLAVYTRLTSSAFKNTELAENIDLVIWPEGAVLNSNLAEPNNSKDERELIQQSAHNNLVITGGSAYLNYKNYNAVYSIANDKVIDRYDKAYLVPFGEWFPLLDPLRTTYDTVFRQFGLPPLVNRHSGKEVKPLNTPLGAIATYICYESVFPHVPRTMASKDAKLIVNISNDAWFGKGRGAEQHFLMGNMRAIETRRYLLRVGNDGITALVNPMGKVVDRFPQGEEGFLVANFSLMDNLTPYVRYGDLLVLLLLIYIIITVAMGIFVRSRENF